MFALISALKNMTENSRAGANAAREPPLTGCAPKQGHLTLVLRRLTSKSKSVEQTDRRSGRSGTCLHINMYVKQMLEIKLTEILWPNYVKGSEMFV